MKFQINYPVFRNRQHPLHKAGKRIWTKEEGWSPGSAFLQAETPQTIAEIQAVVRSEGFATYITAAGIAWALLRLTEAGWVRICDDDGRIIVDNSDSDTVVPLRFRRLAVGEPSAAPSRYSRVETTLLHALPPDSAATVAEVMAAVAAPEMEIDEKAIALALVSIVESGAACIDTAPDAHIPFIL